MRVLLLNRSGVRHERPRSRTGHGGCRLGALGLAVATVATLSLLPASGFAAGVGANAAGGTSLSVDPSYPGAQANYYVDFKAAARAAAGDGIFLSETAGPTGFSTETTVQVTDITQGWQFLASGLRFGTGVNPQPLRLLEVGQGVAGAMEVPMKDTIKRGDTVSMFVEGVTNPQAGTLTDFDVYTTGDPIAMTATPYTIDSVAKAIGADGDGCRSHPARTATAFRPSGRPMASRLCWPEVSTGGAGPSSSSNGLLRPHGPAGSNIFQDMSAFDSYFHLPAVKLTVVPGAAAKASADLAIGEEVEDVEVVHAVAPGAAIRVVLTGATTYSAGATVRDLPRCGGGFEGSRRRVDERRSV